MSNTVLGNKQEYTFYQDYHEVEIDDDEWVEMEGELVDEESIVGFRENCPKASQSASVQVGFYYKPPDSEWYWDYMYGDPYKPIVPVVFTCNNSGNLVECLNQSFTEVALSHRNEGWVVMNVTLKRALVKNELIFFGVYSDLYGVAGIDFADADSVASYYYFSRADRRNYNSAIAYVSSQAFIEQSGKTDCDYCPMIYLEYENAIESVAYTRIVLGNVGAGTALTRKSVLKRTLLSNGNIAASLNRKAVWKRNGTSNGNAAALILSHNNQARTFSEQKSFSDSNNNRISFIRSFDNSTSLTATSSRKAGLKVVKADSFSFLDSIEKLLLIIRSCFFSADSSESIELKADYIRQPESLVDDEEQITRWGDNFRNAAEELNFSDLPFSSRIFYRTVTTVMNFWDWLRGKIREANNVITLFCPIATEIELECRI